MGQLEQPLLAHMYRPLLVWAMPIKTTGVHTCQCVHSTVQVAIAVLI